MEEVWGLVVGFGWPCMVLLNLRCLSNGVGEVQSATEFMSLVFKRKVRTRVINLKSSAYEWHLQP